MKDFGIEDRQETGHRLNSRAGNSLLLPTTGEGMLRFRRTRSLQKFAAAHATVSNHLNQERSLSSRNHFKLNRAAALTEWRRLSNWSEATLL